MTLQSHELNQMKQLLDEAMQAGAFGMSTGLVYPPGCFASTEEIITLCKVVAKIPWDVRIAHPRRA